MKKLKVGQNYDIINSSHCLDRGKYMGSFESIGMQFLIFTTKRKTYHVLCAIDPESENIVALTENAYVDSYEEACEVFTRNFKYHQEVTPIKVDEYIRGAVSGYESKKD